jgi:hypothetical protein
LVAPARGETLEVDLALPPDEPSKLQRVPLRLPQQLCIDGIE